MPAPSDHRKELPDTGVYLASHRGHYIQRDAVLLAKGEGFPLDPFAAYALDCYEDDSHNEDYPHEALVDLTNKAIDWLNDNRPRPGYYWDFVEGDFGLWPDTECEHCAADLAAAGHDPDCITLRTATPQED